MDALHLPEYAGTLRVSRERTVVFSTAFDSARNRQLFWLSEREGVVGYMLTLPRTPDRPSLESVITKGINYELEVKFANSPPANSSIWLEWLQRPHDGIR
jgi:hypothetical protein